MPIVIKAAAGAPAAGEQISVYATVYNYREISSSVAMLAARYDSGGALIGCDLTEHTLQTGEEKLFALENIQLEANAEKIKAFVWEEAFLKPVPERTAYGGE